MKYKKSLDKQHQHGFVRNLDYKEWLMKFILQPTENELSHMGKDPINNISYNPIIGA